MENETSFAPLLLVIFLAFSVPLLLSQSKKLRLPLVVGEILAGIVVGRSGFNLVNIHDPVIDLLAEFGFVFLMFLSGMEIDFTQFSGLGGSKVQPKPSKKLGGLSPLSLGTLSFLLTLTLAVLISFGFYAVELISSPWMMALILSTTSLGVVLPVLKENNLTLGKYGQSLLISALVADFATMFLITIMVALLSRGLTLDILLMGVLFAAFFLIYRLGMIFFNRLKWVRAAMEELSHATSQIKVRAAFAMMLIFVVLSEMLGTEIILGGFLAGAIVSMLRQPEDQELADKLETIGFGFFIPIFFIKVGINFNLEILFASKSGLILVPVLLAAALVVKFIPTLLFKRFFTWRETIAAGALLSARLSLIIAASAIGLQIGVITESVNSAIILVAILTVTLAPLAFVRLIPKQSMAPIKPYIVAGADELGIQVAAELRAHHEKVIIIDPDHEHIQRAQRYGFTAILDRADDPCLEAVEAMNEAEGLISTYVDPDQNFRICQCARQEFGIEQIVAQVNSPEDVLRFKSIGVTTYNALLNRAATMVLLARNPGIYSLLTRADDNKEVIEALVCNPEFIGQPLRKLTLPGDVLVLALRREGELLVPHGNTPIRLGDRLTIVGSTDDIQKARCIFCDTIDE
jgi:CPA2 family monovalent cation:H+ antiporter-2